MKEEEEVVSEEGYDETIELSGGESVMLLMVKSDGGYEMLHMIGEPSEEQMMFVEDLLVLERRSLVLSLVMMIERLWLRLESSIWGLK